MGWLLTLLSCLFAASLRLSTAQTVAPAPVVVPPSQHWEGDDGPWSTFQLRVGIPPQVVRVMASTASPVTWVVLEDACPGGVTTSCAAARGLVFNVTKSTTWQNQGLFNLAVESNLNYTGVGHYGLDTIGLGLTGAQGFALDSQVVAGIVDQNFQYGILGLNNQPTNFSNYNNPIPSYFQSLKNGNLIPSLSWSYTAGNQYSLKKVLGSLVFGGYDASRFTPNSMSFPFAVDSSRDLVVAVQSISSTENSGRTIELLNTGILAFVDSTLPYLYLPLEVCQQFEIAFGLVWDPVVELYLISQSLHSSLVARGLNFTFTLGNQPSGGKSIQIVLSYAAFDLTVTSPIVNNSQSYFPLRRGNSTQYALGRAFLQEAYLIADYERGNFSLSQCVFDEGAKEEIVVIHPLRYVDPANSPSGSGSYSSSSSSSTSLSTGAIAGVAIVGVLFLLGGIFFFFVYRKRKWPFHRRKSEGTAELDSEAVGYEADGRMLGKHHHGNAHEIGTDSKFNDREAELAGMHVGTKNELPGVLGRQGSELHGSEAAKEMPGSGVYTELAGSPVPAEYYGKPLPPPNPSRTSSRTPAATGSPRPEAARKSSGAGVRSPLGMRRESSGLVSPSPVSASRDATRMGRTTSERSGGEGFLRSPVSARSDSREGSASRKRAFDRSGGRGVGPTRAGGSVGAADGSSDVSRDPSRTREDTPGLQGRRS